VITAPTIALAASLLFVAFMVAAGLMDLFTMTIRNTLVVAMLVLYAALAPLAGLGVAAIGASVVVAVLVFVGGLLCFSFGWIGGGDAKLAVSTVLWLGAEQAFSYLMATALFGGLLTLVILAFRLIPLPAGLAGQTWLQRLHGKSTGVPYGVAMALGGLVVLPNSVWWAGLS
jgi:prepilin peptidase CpaA